MSWDGSGGRYDWQLLDLVPDVDKVSDAAKGAGEKDRRYRHIQNGDIGEDCPVGEREAVDRTEHEFLLDGGIIHLDVGPGVCGGVVARHRPFEVNDTGDEDGAIDCRHL